MFIRLVKQQYYKQFIFVTMTIASIIFLQGCSSMKQYNPLPQQLESQVQMPGFHHIRAWGDVPSQSLEKSAIESVSQEKMANHGNVMPVMNALALSGGGADGAFGAGFLCGWSHTGNRPNFKIVTGISAGALIAPFAFLGPAYDGQLKRVYTTISDDLIYKPYSAFSILLSVLNIQPSPSIANSDPLAQLIAKEVTPHMIRQIAAEHKKGRRLLIGTTQFDAQRLVIWNMGEIASVGTPAAIALFRKILLASASLPVTFQPQFFTVEAEGKIYDEMHVDGGLETQVMLYENALYPFSQGKKIGARINRPRKLYIIRNEKIYAEWDNVKPRLKDIAVRSIDSLTKSQGIGDLYRLYTYANRDGLDYNLVFIPRHFNEKEKSPFDNAYMRKVFALGYRMGSSKNPWTKYPPEYSPD